MRAPAYFAACDCSCEALSSTQVCVEKGRHWFRFGSKQMPDVLFLMGSPSFVALQPSPRTATRFEFTSLYLGGKALVDRGTWSSKRHFQEPRWKNLNEQQPEPLLALE